MRSRTSLSSLTPRFMIILCLSYWLAKPASAKAGALSLPYSCNIVLQDCTAPRFNHTIAHTELMETEIFLSFTDCNISPISDWTLFTCHIRNRLIGPRSFPLIKRKWKRISDLRNSPILQNASIQFCVKHENCGIFVQLSATFLLDPVPALSVSPFHRIFRDSSASRRHLR